LKPADHDKRIRYWEWFANFIQTKTVDIPDVTFFTVEAWFHLSGYVNTLPPQPTTNEMLTHNNLSIIKADKGKAMVIVHAYQLQQKKINSFMQENSMTQLRRDRVTKFRNVKIMSTLYQSSHSN
jgi:hypothetical protein